MSYIINYKTATPGVIYIDNNTGVAKPWPVNGVRPVYDEPANTMIGIHEYTYDVRPILPFMGFGSISYQVNGTAQTITTFADAVNYLSTYLYNNTAGGSGSTALTAGEAHIGEVGGNTAQVSITPTITAAAYSANNVIGGKLTLASAMRKNGGTGTLVSITVTDTANQAAAMDIYIFNADPAAGTYTDHAQVNQANSDMANCIRVVSIAATDYKVMTGSNRTTAFADKFVGEEVTGPGGATTLWAVIVCKGSPTYVSTADLQIRFGFYRD